MLHKIKNHLFLILLLSCITPAFIFPNRVSALSCKDGTEVPESFQARGTEDNFCASRGGVSTASESSNGSSTTQQETIQRSEEEFECKKGQQLDECINENPITKMLRLIVNFLSVGVGVVVIIMIIIGGIQYAASRDDPQKVASAKKRVANALLALVAYLFLGAFLQWIVPGGLF